MSDNTTLNAGSGGDVFAADDIGGVKWQRVKVCYGGDGSATDVSTSAPLPVTVLAAATNIAKAEDAVHADGDTGVFCLTVRKDTAAQVAGTDGDYSAIITDSAGRVHVNVGNTVAVTLAAGATAIGKAEDAASADADVGVGALAVRKATPANTSGADGDYEFLQMSAGRLWASVVVDTALPAGTNAIGKLAANSGVTIGAVELAAAQTLATVTTVTSVTNLAQMGGAALAMNTGVRSAGTQRVTLATDDSLAVTNAGTFAVQINGAALTSLQLIDDAVSGSGFNISQINGVTPLMNNGAVGTGSLRVTIANDSTGVLATVSTVTTLTTLTGGGVASGSADSNNPVKVGGKYNSTLPTFTDGQRADLQLSSRGLLRNDMVVPNTSAGVDASNQVVFSTPTSTTTAPIGAACYINNGTNWDRLRGDTTAGVWAQGPSASGSTVAGNPILNGGRAATANPTAVADGQAVRAMYDKLGKAVAVGSVRVLKGKQKTTITSSTAETTIVMAGASGVFQDLYGLIISNTSASACNVTIKDATSGTTQAIIAVPAGETRGFMLTDSSAMIQTTAANNWTATCGTSVASIEITALFVSNL